MLIGQTDTQLGNRCGHDKVNPRFFSTPKQHKSRPDILREAAIQAGRFYQADDQYLTNLRYANGSYQRQRSERREAAAAVLQVLLHYTNLDSLQVGTPRAGGEINGLRIKFIAQKLEFGDKRVWRAITDLKIAGYLSLKSRLVKVSDRLFSVSTIHLFPKTFYDLGISQLKLQMSRHYKQKSLAKQQGREQKNSAITQQDSKQAGRVIGGIQTLIKAKNQTKQKQPAQSAQHKQRHNSMRLAREANAALYKLIQDGQTMDEVRALVDAPESITSVELYKKLQGRRLR